MKGRVGTFGAVIAIAFAAAGCATPTGYQQATVWNDGRGWRDKPVGPGEYSVVVQGNAHTSAERAAAIAMLRAANLTLEQGRERFEVFEAESASRRQDVATNIPLRSGGMTFFVPVDVRNASEPVAVLLVRLVPPGETGGPQALDARAVAAALEPTFE